MMRTAPFLAMVVLLTSGVAARPVGSEVAQVTAASTALWHVYALDWAQLYMT